MAIRPVIGITARGSGGGGGRREIGIPRDYVVAVLQAGGLPALLPAPPDPEGAAAIWVRRVDGLLLSGGGDVSPELYGAAAHPKTCEVVPERDRFEIALCRAAWDRGMPVLGICRGIQVLTVALGGSLMQDIPSESGSELDHYIRSKPDALAHSITCVPGSRIAACLGGRGEVEVNSRHHQCVAGPAPKSLQVTAWAPDGIIEAVESGGGRPVLGVQFHPENLVGGHPEFRGLFSWLVEAAAGSSQS